MVGMQCLDRVGLIPLHSLGQPEQVVGGQPEPHVIRVEDGVEGRGTS